MASIPQNEKKTRSGKAANGSGTIFKRTKTQKRKDGTSYIWEGWEGKATVGVDPLTGKTIRKTVTGKTQNEVRRKITALTGQIDNKTYKPSNDLKVSEWLNIWLNEYMKGVKITTAQTYRETATKHLIPAFSQIKLCNLEPHHVQQYFNALYDSGKLSGKTIQNIHGIFHKALETACNIKIIPYNSADHCELEPVQKPKINTLDRYEIAPFLQALEDDPYKDLITVDLFTGLRLSEIIGLTWDNIDFNNGLIIVNKQLKNIKGGFVWLTAKNGRERIITPADFVMDILRKVRRDQLQAKFAAGSAWDNPDQLVFTQPDGSHVTHTTVRKHFNKAAAAIDRPELRFHDLRHSYATISIQAGDDYKTISENMGHYSVAFTMDRYAKATDSMKRDSAEKMQSFINQFC